MKIRNILGKCQFVNLKDHRKDYALNEMLTTEIKLTAEGLHSMKGNVT